MKARFSLAGVIVLLTFCTCTASASILFYGGDIHANPDMRANGLSNESDSTVPLAAVYTPFEVGGTGWHVTGLFTNNSMSFAPLTADWEIRSGVSDGNGGTLVSSGSATPAVIDLGPTPPGLSVSEMYTVQVTGLDVTLTPGQYWLSVVPVCLDCSGRSYNNNTDGTNAIGPPEPWNQSYFASAFYGANFTNALNPSTDLHAFSSGVLGDASAAPEPGTMTFFGGGLLLVGGLVRRRSSR